MFWKAPYLDGVSALRRSKQVLNEPDALSWRVPSLSERLFIIRCTYPLFGSEERELIGQFKSTGDKLRFALKVNHTANFLIA